MDIPLSFRREVVKLGTSTARRGGEAKVNARAPLVRLGFGAHARCHSVANHVLYYLTSSTRNVSFCSNRVVLLLPPTVPSMNASGKSRLLAIRRSDPCHQTLARIPPLPLVDSCSASVTESRHTSLLNWSSVNHCAIHVHPRHGGSRAGGRMSPVEPRGAWHSAAPAGIHVVQVI